MTAASVIGVSVHVSSAVGADTRGCQTKGDGGESAAAVLIERRRIDSDAELRSQNWRVGGFASPLDDAESSRPEAPGQSSWTSERMR